MRRQRRAEIAVYVLVAILALLVAWPTSSSGSPSKVKAEIRSVFGPARAPKAILVAKCESRLRPRAVSKTGDVGAFQINYSAHHRPGESFAAFKRRMFHVDRNVRFAYRLSRRGTDWSPWKWSRHCWSRG